jgi:phage terminase large subunit-like protein
MLRPDADMFLEEIIRFPNAESRDFVDTMTQALFRLQECGMLNHTKNEQYEEQNFKKRNLY